MSPVTAATLEIRRGVRGLGYSKDPHRDFRHNSDFGNDYAHDAEVMANVGELTAEEAEKSQGEKERARFI